MNRLLILATDAEEYSSLLTAKELPQLEVVTASRQEEALAVVAECNIILGEPFLIDAVLPSASRLEWVQSSWAGVESLCRPGLRHDYVLTGVKDIFGALISEYVFTYLFALERRIFDMRSDQLQQHWQPRPYRRARDLTLGIVGLGSIGQYVASTARCFGFHVTGFSRSGEACEGVDTVYSGDRLGRFLADVDYLVLTLPSSPQTRHFINAEVLSMMKSSAVLINVGRGSIVDESALVSALQQGQIGGAVLDVFETEPLPADSPLWGFPNVFVTPHFAAASFPQDVVGIFVENYSRFIKSEPLLHIIDFSRGY